MISSRQSRDLIVATLLVGAYLAIATVWQDVYFYDESIYLASGSRFAVSTFLNDLTSAPLYGLWYRGLSLIATDAVSRYFLSWGLLVVIVALAPAIAGVERAWLYTLALVALPFFNVWPYVTLFAASIVVIGLLVVARRAMDVTSAVVSAALVSIVVSFCRSEYAYGAFVAVAASIVFIIRTRSERSSASNAARLIAICVAAAALVVPMRASDMSRTGNAFAQHYNLRAVKEGKLVGEDPWLSSYAQRTFKVDEGNTVVNVKASIGDFFRADPLRFLKFVASNTVDIGNLALLASLLVLLVPWLFAPYASLRSVSAYLLLVTLPVIASFTLIYPDRHYAAVVFPSIVLFYLLVLDRSRFSRAAWSSVGIVVSLCAGWFYTTYSMLGHHTERRGLRTIACIRAIDPAAPGVDTLYFDPIGLPDVFLKSAHRRVPIYDFRNFSEFERWLIDEKPNLVLITPTVGRQYGVTHERVDRLLADELGYERMACDADTDVVAYRLNGDQRSSPPPFPRS